MKWFAEHAWLPTGLANNVLLDESAGVWAEVTAGASQGDATRLPGLVVPGLANNHSHAFHRALRGRTHDAGGTFWTWRDRMYAVAARLDPDSYLDLARATYAEMTLAGITGVGEFHYLHHQPDGTAYADPNAMAEALRQAAAEAGIRLTLLDACYLAGGLNRDGHQPLEGVQRRFGDGDVAGWAERVDALSPSDAMRVGVAAHSVRAVPREALPVVVEAAGDRPLHVHLSEQPAENEATQQFYGQSPTSLFAAVGALGSTTTVVHATHVTPSDIVVLGRSGTAVCACPTTERDLADGIGPIADLAEAGTPLSLGGDQHTVVDLFEEARALEMDQRLRSLRRGHFAPSVLVDAMTRHGGIGWPDAGRLETGSRADLVAVRLDSVRTAGCAPDQALLAATAADVATVVVDGRTVVEDGRHMLGDVGELLARAIEPLWAGT